MHDVLRPGKLYLVPMPLGKGGEEALSVKSLDVLSEATYFLAENPKTFRRQLKVLLPEKDLQACYYRTFDKNTPPDEIESLLQPVKDGNDLCLVSEGGAPCIADPGSIVVQRARNLNITVVPLAGPSSILLSLMASGLNGQRFCFHGYLPRNMNQLQSALRKLEMEAQTGSAQIFMETPYRNERLMTIIVKTLRPGTTLCVAREVTTSSEWIECKTIEKWRHDHWPDLQKKPAIFILGTE